MMEVPIELDEPDHEPDYVEMEVVTLLWRMKDRIDLARQKAKIRAAFQRKKLL